MSDIFTFNYNFTSIRMNPFANIPKFSSQCLNEGEVTFLIK